jgi:alpha/beta superfamily hydrolase
VRQATAVATQLASLPRSLFARLRRAYRTFGLFALAVLTVWNVWAFQPHGVADAVLSSSASIEVVSSGEFLGFRPVTVRGSTGVVFFPGGLVDPEAYAPLAHALARDGVPVLIVRLPRRGAFSSVEVEQSLARRALELRQFQPAMTRWIAAGHSKGALFAARCLEQAPDRWHGLALLGSSHPKDFSLAHYSGPTLRIAASRDRIASLARQQATRRNLPTGLREIVIEGGNHSQFGYYGFQFGDRFAGIPRAEQQRQVTAGLLELVHAVETHDFAVNP